MRLHFGLVVDRLVAPGRGRRRVVKCFVSPVHRPCSPQCTGSVSGPLRGGTRTSSTTMRCCLPPSRISPASSSTWTGAVVFDHEAGHRGLVELGDGGLAAGARLVQRTNGERCSSARSVEPKDREPTVRPPFADRDPVEKPLEL